MRGGTTRRDDGGNWLGVDKKSGFTPRIIGGGVLEAGTATGSETVANAGVSGGGGGATRLDFGWCVSSAEDTAAKTASVIQDIIRGSDGAAFTLGSTAARGERRPDGAASAVERQERVVLDLLILKKLRKR